MCIARSTIENLGDRLPRLVRSLFEQTSINNREYGRAHREKYVRATKTWRLQAQY